MTVSSPYDPIVRGASVNFPISFFDINDDPVVPSTVVLYVSYKHNGTRTTVQPAVTPSGNTFLAQWDTTPADPGVVDWHVRSTGAIQIGGQGSFTVVANPANPAT